MVVKNIGFILLAVYLILVGIMALVPSLPIPGIVAAIIAIVSGVFILIGK